MAGVGSRRTQRSAGAFRQPDAERRGHLRRGFRRRDDDHRRERLFRHRAGRAGLRHLRLQEPIGAAGLLRPDHVSGAAGTQRVRRRRLRARAGVPRRRYRRGSDDDAEQQRGLGGGARHAGRSRQPDRGDRLCPHRGVRVALFAAAVGGGLPAEPAGHAVLGRYAGSRSTPARASRAPARVRSTARSTPCCSRRRRARRWRRAPASDRSVRSAAATSTSASNRGCGTGVRAPAWPTSTTSSSI